MDNRDWDAFDYATRDFPDEVKDDDAFRNFGSQMFEREWTGDYREFIYKGVRDYVSEEFGLDFDEIFDWDAYRDWYASQ